MLYKIVNKLVVDIDTFPHPCTYDTRGHHLRLLQPSTRINGGLPPLFSLRQFNNGQNIAIISASSMEHFKIIKCTNHSVLYTQIEVLHNIKIYILQANQGQYIIVVVKWLLAR